MKTFIHKLFAHLRRRRGQGMTEYGLIIAFVAILLVSALSLLHEPITQIFSSVVAALGM